MGDMCKAAGSYSTGATQLGQPRNSYFLLTITPTCEVALEGAGVVSREAKTLQLRIPNTGLDGTSCSNVQTSKFGRTSCDTQVVVISLLHLSRANAADTYRETFALSSVHESNY